MQSAPQAQLFFEKVILDYICGDIRWFIKKRAKPIGPLLACVSAGVDTVGGVIGGFDSRSSDRSITFIRDYMGQDETTAQFIYAGARCGYIHEGIGKYKFGWFVAYHKDLTKDLLFRRRDNEVVLNVVAYAKKFVHASKTIWDHDREVLQYLPESSRRELREKGDRQDATESDP